MRSGGCRKGFPSPQALSPEGEGGMPRTPENYMEHRKFADFYKAYLDKIYRYVFFRVGCKRETAEDITSDIFIKALANFESYDPTRGAGWIFTIARNTVINFWRDKYGREIAIEEIEDKEMFSSNGIRALEAFDDKRQLMEALSVLPKEKRELVTLKYLDGYSYADIAKMRGKEAGALKVAAHRALKEVKAKLKHTADRL